MTLTTDAARNVVRACLTAAGNPNPATPSDRAAWDDATWRALAIIATVNREGWPCWTCWLATRNAYPCLHGTWWMKPRPVYLPNRASSAT